ncbi:hypothetical protein F4604DRAFT_1690658 [Suillus subluteus]|nr:hypothetical protein F4604DRAFT_1690658 [Suillus subluteus]
MPSKTRALVELTRIHWFPVSQKMHAGHYWGSLAAPYHVASPMDEVVTNTLFYALLGTLAPNLNAGCAIKDVLDHDFDHNIVIQSHYFTNNNNLGVNPLEPPVLPNAQAMPV